MKKNKDIDFKKQLKKQKKFEEQLPTIFRDMYKFGDSKVKIKKLNYRKRYYH